mmetsp:Transcript_1440/g.3263  ORF Transcript_1440/g.3263 Transcript_1440/m.3263 type:complete len:211 (+) Transcript_1440:444-1076(+)
MTPGCRFSSSQSLSQVLEAAFICQRCPALKPDPASRPSSCQAPPCKGDDRELQETLKSLITAIVGMDLGREDFTIRGLRTLASLHPKASHTSKEVFLRGCAIEVVRANYQILWFMEDKEASPFVDAPEPGEVVPGEDDDEAVAELKKFLNELYAEPRNLGICLGYAALVDPEAHIPPPGGVSTGQRCTILGHHTELGRLQVAIGDAARGS